MNEKWKECMRDLARWYVEHRRLMRRRDMRPIVRRHFPDEAEAVPFYDYLATRPGQYAFRKVVREEAAKAGIELKQR